ncbi:glycosyltransferase family 4 protein [Paenibacillus sp. IHBB 10380]|uniref:glycosyltransferase family 4 protein n=1 Tax=Paenibacillus sp. IHBB 10380 TaxID=1566358 RepID=UPI0005CFA412|nr:glycosyltransferase family 4 protein [Paenibacillus sp. IHBB 10380]AJS57464.1 glycosyl transferase family 1 [Paenibacillus sp. IHBB 10380]
MRFTFPILTLCHGGAQRMLVEITNRLTKGGHEVYIVMPKQGVIKYDIYSNLVHTTHTELYESDFPISDIIISNFYTTVPVAEQASKNGKGIHIRLSLCYEPTFLTENHVSFPSYHMVPNLLVLSGWQQQMIFNNHGIYGSIVPVGVNYFFKNLKIRSETEQSVNVSAIIRMPEGGFAWHREQNYLIEQLTKVKTQFPSVQINLISPPGEYYQSPILQTLKDTGYFVIYTPADDLELRYHYNQTDIFVSSGTYDTGSLPGLEAMRCGAALVTLYAGGNTEYAVNEVNCLMTYRYENKLATDIIRLLENPALRKELAMKGERDSYHFSWERSYTAFERAVLDMVSRANL